MSRPKSGLPFLYDEITDRIGGVQNSNGIVFGLQQIIATSAVPITRTSANTAADQDILPFVEILIPAYSMGRNGTIRVDWTLSNTSSANAKNGRLLFGGVSIQTPPMTTGSLMRTQVTLHNQNSFDSQLHAFVGGNTSAVFASSVGTSPTYNVDTTQNQVLFIGSSWNAATAAETITLERYHVEIIYAD